MKTEISIDLWGGKRLSQLLVLFLAFALVLQCSTLKIGVTLIDGIRMTRLGYGI